MGPYHQGEPVDRPVLLAALRTPYGRRGGLLSRWHPVDLSGVVLEALAERAGISPGQVDRVVWAANSQVGAQAANLGRRAVLAAGWPETVPALTVDAQAASSLEAVLAGAESVAAGWAQVVVAGGAESASAVPLGAAISQPAVGRPFGERLTERYKRGSGMPPPGLVAEQLAVSRSLTRRQLDDWAIASHRRAMAHRACLSANLVDVGAASAVPSRPEVPKPPASVSKATGGAPAAAAGQPLDEGLSAPLAVAGVRSLPPAYLEGGVVTAANFALEGDGAAGVVLASASFARRHGLRALAEVVAWGRAGFSPSLWPSAAVEASRTALDRAGRGPCDVGCWRVLEQSSAAVLAWALDVGVDLAEVNRAGGELATGCPLGAAGAGMLAGILAERSEKEGNGLALVAAAGEGGVGTACALRL